MTRKKRPANDAIIYVEAERRYRVDYDRDALCRLRPGPAPFLGGIQGVKTALSQAKLTSRWGVGAARVHDDGQGGVLLAIYENGQPTWPSSLPNSPELTNAWLNDQAPTCRRCQALLNERVDIVPLPPRKRDGRTRAQLPRLCLECRKSRGQDANDTWLRSQGP